MKKGSELGLIIEDMLQIRTNYPLPGEKFYFTTFSCDYGSLFNFVLVNLQAIPNQSSRCKWKVQFFETELYF